MSEVISDIAETVGEMSETVGDVSEIISDVSEIALGMAELAQDIPRMQKETSEIKKAIPVRKKDETIAGCLSANLRRSQQPRLHLLFHLALEIKPFALIEF